MAPYLEAEQQLLETLGAGGGLGSARGGFSGQGAAGLGRYWADAGQQYGRDLWGMIAPAQQAGWGAELQRGQQGWQAELGRGQQDWGAQLAQSMFGAQAGQEQWRAGLQEQRFPFDIIPGLFGQSMPSPVVTQGGGGGGLMGGLTGGAMGAGIAGAAGMFGTAGGAGVAAAAASPWLWPLIGGSALMGMFS
jgi:hypothetical protein